MASPNSNPSSGGITPLRERLLVEARRIATLRRVGIGDVITLASRGTFGFGGLTKLTDADLGIVDAALRELAGMTV